MKMTKKLIALCFAALLAVSAVGCHPKDEVAVKSGDVSFTSAYYMCALVNADSEARSKVQEGLSDEEKNAEEINYFSHKVEDTDYVKWVKDRAMEMLKETAFYKTKCADAKLTLDDDAKSNAEMYASYYWTNYGYASMFEPNGVGQETFKNYMLDSNYASLYFDSIYGKDGSKAITADEVSKKMAENFQLANVIDVSFSEKQESEITALKSQFNGYVDALKKGSQTFEQVYHAYNNTEESSDDAQNGEADADAVKPVNKHASILGAEGTDYASENYDTVKQMKVGEVKLIEKADNAGLTLIVKCDLAKDAYYVDRLDTPVRHLIKDEEFEADTKAAIKDMKFDVSSSAIDRFKVKKIVYPEAQQ